MTEQQRKVQTPVLPPANTSPRLTSLAVHKVVDALDASVKRLDTFISKEITKLGSLVDSVSPAESKSVQEGTVIAMDSLASSSTSGTAQATKMAVSSSFSVVDHSALRKAAKDMLEARKYLAETLQEELHPFVLKHVIARAVNDRNVQLVRVAIGSDVSVLDFRALDNWLSSSETPPHASVSSSKSSVFLHKPPSEMTLSDFSGSKPSTADTEVSVNTPTSTVNVPYDVFHPPNEFDWFSRDKMGKILSMPEVCELFSIIKMSGCAEQLDELYINAKRATFYASSLETLSVMTETLSDLEQITKLVLRGFCDDDMLKIIGKRCSHLKYLDVSGSQFVTDTGIQDLFFKERTQNSALYLIPTWITKNLDKMTNLTQNLAYFDYSWTSVSSAGRKMVQLFPGSYLFKRLYFKNEQDGFGHHIFIREAASLQDFIPTKVDASQSKTFEKRLSHFVGIKGVKTFLKMVEYHPWRNCVLNVYSLKNPDEEDDNGPTDKNCYGIITPNQTEKRIQGIVHWCNGVLTQLYTIYPVNINTLGILGQLRLFRGIVNDTWRMQSSLLPFLVQLDIFVEPATLINIIQSCPNLRKLLVRVRRCTLTDEHILKPIQNSMCRRTLEDIWIAPGAHPGSPVIDKEKPNKPVSQGRSPKSDDISSNAANSPSLNGIANETECEDQSVCGSNVSELVQLSLNCMDAIIGACPNLKRLGDISLWAKVEAEELYLYCEELKETNLKVIIIWANMNLPDCRRQKTRC